MKVEHHRIWEICLPLMHILSRRNNTTTGKSRMSEWKTSFERSKLNPSYDNIAKNFADLTGLAETQQQFRSCTFCADNLKKRDARINLTTESQSPILSRYYEKLRELMIQGIKMSDEYRGMACSLNAGEAATTMKLEEAKHLRVRLLKVAENVDAVSKCIGEMP